MIAFPRIYFRILMKNFARWDLSETISSAHSFMTNNSRARLTIPALPFLFLHIADTASPSVIM